MTSHNSTVTITLFSLIALCLIAVIGFTFYRIKVDNQQVSDTLTLTEENMRKEIVFQSLRALRNTAKAELAAFDQIVFSQEKLVRVIEMLESAARARSLMVGVISVDEVAAEGNIPAGVRIIAEASGAWRNALLFLQALESLPYRVIFEEADLAKVENIWRLNLVILIPSFN